MIDGVKDAEARGTSVEVFARIAPDLGTKEREAYLRCLAQSYTAADPGFDSELAMENGRVVLSNLVATIVKIYAKRNQ